jgi:radical SAM superfamily enzyme YgiQ (UPF0313 family)
MLVSQYPQLEILKSILENFEPDLVLISTITGGWYSTNEITRTIKSYNPSITIAIGGVFPSLVGDIIYRKYKYFDIVVKGEGELVIEQIVSKFLETGIFPKGVFTSTEEFQIPTLNLTPILEYSKIFDHFPFPIEIGRGCPFSCVFCYLRDFNKPIRSKPIETLLSEFSMLNNYGIKKLFFSDDNLNLNSAYCKKLLIHLSSYNFKIILETRLDYLSWSIIKNLKKSGVSEIIYGIEHINVNILSSMRKIEEHSIHKWRTKAYEMTKLLNNECIIAHPIFMLGWPGETRSTLEKLEDFACVLGKLENVEPFVSFATPHPGSSFNRFFQSEFSSITKNLRKYIHLLPVSIPKTLGPDGLCLLVNAHNQIRIESNMSYRNPTISLNNIMAYWDLVDYTTIPFFI